MANSFVQIIDNTRHVLDEIKRAKVRGLEAVGAMAERYAKEECPVDTNRLRSSISHAVVNDEFVIIGTNVEYAPYVEFDDTKHHEVGKAHFLRDSATLHDDEYRELVRQSIINA